MASCPYRESNPATHCLAFVAFRNLDQAIMTLEVLHFECLQDQHHVGKNAQISYWLKVAAWPLIPQLQHALCTLAANA